MKPASLSPLEYWKGFGYSKQSNRTWAALEYLSVFKCLFGLQTVLLFPKLGLPVSMQTGLGVLRGLQSKPSPFPGWELMSSGVGKVGDHVKDYFAMSSVPPDSSASQVLMSVVLLLASVVWPSYDNLFVVGGGAPSFLGITLLRYVDICMCVVNMHA